MLSERNNHHFSTPTTGLCIARKEKKQTLENMRNFSNSTLLPETYTRSVAHGRVEEEVSRKILKLLVKTP